MKPVFKTNRNHNYFFGYYDKSPLSFENDILLVCRAPFNNRMPTSKDKLEIGYIDWRKSDEFIKITQTSAWNWQQGCMLKWFDKKCNKIIYNDIIDNNFVTVCLNIKSLEKEFFPMSYYSASSNNSFLLCIDNERHHFFRPGYSYRGIENFNKKVKFLKSDGIWHIDCKTKKLKQIITLKQLVNINYLSTMKDATHYVEHLMINPNDTRFAFLHRWETEDGGIHSRLLTANIDGTKIFILNDSGRMSHFCWKNNSEIVGWGGISNPINSLRKNKRFVKYLIRPLLPIYKKIIKGDSVHGNSKISRIVSGDSYIILKDNSNKKRRIYNKNLNIDGHPSFSKSNQNLMLTDTYPTAKNSFKQKLMIYDFQNDNVINSHDLSYPAEYAATGYRCDLHPKWSLDGNYISVDTLEQGIRSIYIYEL